MSGDKLKVHFSSMTDHWSTPKGVYEQLNLRFNFNCDPCPLNCDPSYNGLHSVWGSRVFCNPPYSQLKAWLKKGYEESKKGKLIVFLIPSRTDTIAWHEYCMKADEIIFIKGRLKFGNSKNSAPFPSAVVIFNGNTRTEQRVLRVEEIRKIIEKAFDIENLKKNELANKMIPKTLQQIYLAVDESVEALNKAMKRIPLSSI